MWGINMLHLIKRVTSNKQQIQLHFSIVCLLGLVGITVLTSTLSLFIPLGTWPVHLVIFLPCIFFLFHKSETKSLSHFKKQFSQVHPAIFFLFFSCIVMLLVMSSWNINHPDTLSYHAQIIQWIEKYKVIPGLVHLDTRYGLQGSWFISCAIFSFKFTGIEALTFINSTVLVWYFVFIIQKINENIFKPANRLNGFLWIGLAIMSIWSYTQVRLTATSASPDFIASLFVWTIFLLLLEKKINTEPIYWILIILFSLFAITIKLSTFPIIIIAGFAAFKIIQQKNIRQIIAVAFITILTLFPFAARNIISSGYLVFPSAFPDVANVDWKMDKGEIRLEKDYIKAYARNPINRREKIRATLTMKPDEWVPIWWKNRSMSDRVFIILIVASFIIALIQFRKIIKASENIKIAFLTSLAGCIFWFTQAPDLRFGFGFIVAFLAVVAGLLITNRWDVNLTLVKKILAISVFILGLVIGGYCFYRFTNFFSLSQVVYPLGVKNSPFKTIQFSGIDFRIPEQSEGCGSIDIPCIYDSCQHLHLRGVKIEDGFRAK
jgi:hypothetical protein